jgi:hypothetical protein
MQTLIKNAMAQDFSFERSAKEYIRLYISMLEDPSEEKDVVPDDILEKEITSSDIPEEEKTEQEEENKE